MERSWMLFVDGENLTIRGQELAKAQNLELKSGPHWKEDVFLWAPSLSPLYAGWMPELRSNLEATGKRATYYTSTKADTPGITDIHDALWSLNFEPHVFKREKGRGAKGVDISLTKDMLIGAFQGHYDVALLMSGDADFVPVVEEVKRFGKRVILMFFSGPCLNPNLRRSCDEYYDIGGKFFGSWHVYLQAAQRNMR